MVLAFCIPVSAGVRTTWVGSVPFGTAHCNRKASRRPRRPVHAQTRAARGGSGSVPGPVRRLSGRNVVVSGATGFVGRALVRALLKDDAAQVFVLARDPVAASASIAHPAVRVLLYDAAEPGPLDGSVERAVEYADAVVNLAGEPIDQGRWTDERKKGLWDSRVVGSAKLARAAERSAFCGTFITASAVGFYGTSKSAVFTETSKAGGDYLAKLANAWESAVWRYTRSSDSVRTVVLRIGVVLGPDGGIVAKMTAAFRAFLGGALGGGGQWFSWVHRDDLVEMIVQCIVDPSWSGTYNCTAPSAVHLSQFCSELGRVLERPSWLTVPALAVKAALGSEAAQLVLAGQHVKPERMLAQGFPFRFEDVSSALEDVLQAKDVTSSVS